MPYDPTTNSGMVFPVLCPIASHLTKYLLMFNLENSSHGRTDAFPGWPPKLPPTQYASYPATWRAHQKSLHKSIQEHERCTGPWRPLYLLWEFAVSLVEWAVAGGLSLLELFMSVLLSICSRITPVVAITIFVLVLLAFALVVTLVTVITAEMMLARERQMQQHSQKRRLVIQLPNYSTNPRISTVKRRLLISPQAR